MQAQMYKPIEPISRQGARSGERLNELPWLPISVEQPELY